MKKTVFILVIILLQINLYAQDVKSKTNLKLQRNQNDISVSDDALYLSEWIFGLDYFLIENETIEYPTGNYGAQFSYINQNEPNDDEVLEFAMYGMCGNQSSFIALVNTDNTLTIQTREGTTTMECNPIDYPDGNSQEERFFTILTGDYYMQPSNPLPVNYTISDNGTTSILTIWTDENEKLVFHADNTVGSINKIFKNEFSLYPNPLKNELTIKSNILNYSVEIYTVLGKRILQLHNQDLIVQLDLTFLSKGVYLLKVADGENSFIKKIVKE